MSELRKVEEVAFLRSKGQKIENIVTILRIPRATVNQNLRKAEAMGLFKQPQPVFAYEKVSPERIGQLRLLDHYERLGDRLREITGGEGKSTFQRVHVVESGSWDDSERGFALRLPRFGLEAAPVLCEMLRHSHQIGVSWGATVASVINGMSVDHTSWFRGHRPLMFVPTCGEPYGVPSRKDSSTYLAAEFDQRINGSIQHSLSLSGIPAVIPKEFAKKGEDAVIRRFLESCPSYKAILVKGSKGKPLIEEIDTIITSAGSQWRMCGAELCATGGINRREFETNILGDIGGVLLPRSEYPSPEAQAFVTDTQRLWTGIRMQDFQRVAKEWNPHKGGVILIAIGKNKAHIVYRAIKAGIVNFLLCDEALAEGLSVESGAPARRETFRAEV